MSYIAYSNNVCGPPAYPITQIGLLLGSTLHGQPFKLRPAFLNPFVLHQLLLIRVVKLVNKLDGALADACDRADLADGLRLVKQVTREVEGATRDRHG